MPFATEVASFKRMPHTQHTPYLMPNAFASSSERRIAEVKLLIAPATYWNSNDTTSFSSVRRSPPILTSFFAYRLPVADSCTLNISPASFRYIPTSIASADGVALFGGTGVWSKVVIASDASPLVMGFTYLNRIWRANANAAM